MDLGGYTAAGPRDANEDSFFALDFSCVNSFSNAVSSFVMVSDGMGGYQGGDVASRLAVSCAESYLNQLLEMAAGNQISFEAPVALSEIAKNAHEAIVAEARSRGSVSMGATFVGAFLSPTHAWIGHVGDSRAYLVHNGEIHQITEDHSQVGRMLSQGLISEEEAQNHPARNRIERALGFSDAGPDINEVDLAPGDALMLCSDGVYTVLDRDAICDCLAGGRKAEACAKRIVKAALSHGTDDNATAVVAFNVADGSGAGAKRRSQPTIQMDVASVPHFKSEEVFKSQGGAGSSKQESSSSRTARAMGVPIAIAAVAAIVVIAAVIIANQQFSSGGDVGENVVAEQPSSKGPLVEGPKHRTVGKAAMLKCVYQGESRGFEDFGLTNDGIVQVSAGKDVEVEMDSVDGSVALSRKYLDNLLSDLGKGEAVAQGASGQSGSDSDTLAKSIDSESFMVSISDSKDEYVKFLESLINAKAQGDFEPEKLERLTLSENCFE